MNAEKDVGRMGDEPFGEKGRRMAQCGGIDIHEAQI